MATRLVGVDSENPALPDTVIAASVGTTAGTLAAGEAVAVALMKGRQKPAAEISSAYVAMTFDDGHISCYTEAFPRLSRRGMVGTLCITPAFIGGEDRMTWAQVREMEAAGWEIASHGYDHTNLTTVTTAEAIADLERSKAELMVNGVRRVRGYAAPYGLYDPTILAEIKKRYEWNRFNGEDATHPALWTIDRWNLTCYNPALDLARFMATVDRAIYNGLYCGPLFHHLGPTSDGLNTYAVGDFETFLDHLEASQVQVGTVSDRLVRGLTPDYAGTELAYNGGLHHGSAGNLTNWTKPVGNPGWAVGLDPDYPTLPVASSTSSADQWAVQPTYWSPVTPGTVYLCEQTMRADASFGVGLGGRIFITWYQADKTTVISNSSLDSIVLSADHYRTFALEATAPPLAAYCLIRMRSQDTSTRVFVSRVSFRRKL